MKIDDFSFIDGYLTNWDAFAQGQKELLTTIKKDVTQFSSELSKALDKGDKRAPSRFVFFAVVQVGGFIPLDSQLGKAFHKQVGETVPIFTSEEDGKKSYFAGDLYFWWEKHKSEFAEYSLYDEWSKREFTRNVALKLYQSTSKNHQ